MKIYYSPNFLRAAKKLPPPLRQEVVVAEELFLKNHLHPKLHTHKLAGKFEDYWSFSVNFRYRILFKFMSPNEVLFVTVGDHSVYQ